MEKEGDKLKYLKGKNPFKVPEGYMEGLTTRIMEQLPERPHEEPKRISMSDRIRPWLYLAAVFAGLGWFFKAIVGIMPMPTDGVDSLLVKATPSEETINTIVVEEDEDQEYLEYIEAQYADYLMAEEIAKEHE